MSGGRGDPVSELFAELFVGEHERLFSERACQLVDLEQQVSW